MIRINENKCIKCKKCIISCPAGIFKEGDGIPVTVNETICIKCFHCAASCRHDAISFDGIKELTYNNSFSPQRFDGKLKNFLMQRRSYRQFKDAPVNEEIIREALSISSWAPSAKNQHPVMWIVLRNKNKINTIMKSISKYCEESGENPEILRALRRGNNIVFGNSQTIIIAYATHSAVNPFADSVLALYNAELVLQAQGIGTCWAGYLMDLSRKVEEINEMLGIPKHCEIYAAMLIGYSEEEYANVPNRIKPTNIIWT